MSSHVKKLRPKLDSLITNLASGEKKKAAQAFEELTETVGIEGVLSLLKSLDVAEEVRLHALFVFASLAPPNIAARAAWEICIASDTELREAGLSKLTFLGLPASLALPLWFFALRDKSEDIGRSASREILHIFPKLSEEELWKLRTPDPQVRLSRLWHLITIQPELEPMLDSLRLAMEGKEPFSEGCGKESDLKSTDQSTGDLASAFHENQAPASSATAMNSLGRHQGIAQQVAIQFRSTDELDAVIDWLWNDPEMQDLPRVHVGHNTMIVPMAAIERFRKQGYHFTEQEVVSAGDLDAEVISRIRCEGGLPTT